VSSPHRWFPCADDGNQDIVMSIPKQSK